MNSKSEYNALKTITFVYGDIRKKLPIDPRASQRALTLILTTKFKIMEGYKIVGFVGNRDSYLKFFKFSALISASTLPSGSYRIIVAQSKPTPKAQELLLPINSENGRSLDQIS
jgi:hypothetical protein